MRCEGSGGEGVVTCECEQAAGLIYYCYNLQGDERSAKGLESRLSARCCVCMCVVEFRCVREV